MGAATLTKTKTDADFSGWATKANLKCSDGRTIMPEAFAHMDGQTIPLVWQHGHDDVENVLGHALLEARDEGMYAYAFFNETPKATVAKSIVQHGDVKSLSIWANNLVERTKQVFHGKIRELSLVLSGANPGALIENVAIAHADGDTTVLADEAVIFTGLPIELRHSDGGENLEHAEDDSIKKILESYNEEQMRVLQYMVGEALATAAAHSDGGTGDDDKIVHSFDGSNATEVFETYSDEQKSVVNTLITKALQDAGISHSADGEIIHTDKEGNELVTKNLFENNGSMNGSGTATAQKRLSHTQLQQIVGDAKELGSFKKAFENFISHATEYGIEDIDLLFPDARTLQNTPELISRKQEWVTAVLNGARKAPFSRIKTLWADITHDEARAKGYIKGSLKKDEWFKLQGRTTTPTTVYKKQKLDRDDVIEITDLDVVAWLKAEMRLMLDEEIARASLVGDGRDAADEDKINEDNIRPIATDSDFFSHKVVLPSNVSVSDQLVEEILRARPVYRGTGSPTLFLTEAFLTDLLLGRDKMGRRFYNSVEELRVALRVSDIQTVDVMEGATTDNGQLVAILVNMADYTMGSTRGGQVTMFDDFDIDYNQLKYLIEGRMSGALTKFKSAIVFTRAAGTLVNPTVPTFDAATGVVTVPNQAGVVYRNADTDAELAAGPQPAVQPGATTSVSSEPDDGYYFPGNITTEWTFTRSA